MSEYPKIAQLKTVAAFRARLAELGLELPVDDEILTAAQRSPLAQPISLGPLRVGNRWCIHPMEGWDANRDGSPSELTLRRWRNFGASGAKLIWGGEAAAVDPAGRANPNQTLATPANKAGLAALLQECLTAHRSAFGTTDDLVVGLQLTHSGRFCRPNSRQLEPKIAYHHPLLDEKFGIHPDDDSVVFTDDELERLIDQYVVAAGLARDVGFQFVDVKACHGYLLHEFLSARTRPGRFGGDFDGRTRLLFTIIGRIQEAYPDLYVMVRLSIFDTLPYRTSREVGRPMAYEHLLPYPYGFGTQEYNPLEYDLTEGFELLKRLKGAGVLAANISCGSPYYNPHIQRPAIFPPSDGYQPPEDPLVGVVRQIQAARACKIAVPDLPMVGTGFTYLQDYLPQVAQAVVRAGWIDLVGLGRMVLSYPELPADSLDLPAAEAGGADTVTRRVSEGTTTRRSRLDRKRICRTFSDCTTAPRNSLASGCYPLDAFYKQRPEAEQLKAVKQSLREG
jgi:2,4-dienoyl-CoA reductase-like NADH-dependent reductase (Old Yellow Enzyme family)